MYFNFKTPPKRGAHRGDYLSSITDPTSLDKVYRKCTLENMNTNTATTFVGMKELRQNMSKITARAQKKGQRLIVLRKNKPIFELRPLSEEDIYVETLGRDLEEARADVRAGRVHSQEEIMRMFNV